MPSGSAHPRSHDTGAGTQHAGSRVVAVGARQVRHDAAVPPVKRTDSHDLVLQCATLAPEEGTRIYARLRKDVIDAGILHRDYRFYAASTVIIIVGIAISLTYLIRTPVSAPLVFWSLALAFFCVQICGIVHDAGHRAIFTSTRGNDIAGEVSGFLLGMGYHWWRIQHNVHHAHTNRIGQDPDLNIPLHAFTVERFACQTGLWRRLRRHQVFLFYPMRTLVVFSRRLTSIKYFQTQSMSVKLILEIGLWIIGMCAWFVVPFLAFPLTKALMVSAIVHLSMGAYLSNVFAPNHKGMPQFDEGFDVSFLEQQIVTSRNIARNWLTDFVYFGLNYQIEHHLFPNCPRSKLKHITPYVLEVCRQTGLPYTETGIWESNQIIISGLRRVVRSSG